MKNVNIIIFILNISIFLMANTEFSHFPIQESGRIKPLDTFARNQLLLFSGKDYLKADADNEENISAIEWLIKLLSNPSEELNRKIFHISKWDNSPEVEIGLGLDGRDTHKYSFYEIIEGFRNNQELLKGLQSKNPESYTYVEKQIIDIYKKVVFLDEIAHSFTCIIPLIEISNDEIKQALNIRDDVQKVSYSFFVSNTELFSPLLENLLSSNPDNWTDRDRELNKILYALEQLTRYKYADALKIIPSVSSDNTSEWLSPWEIMEPKAINLKQNQLIVQLEKLIYENLKSDLELNISEFESYDFLLNEVNQDASSIEINFSKMDREVHYNDFKFFNKSLIFYLLSFFLLGLYWLLKNDLLRKIALAMISVGLLIHSAGIINRMIIMSRPPVTTLYESIIFVGFVLVLISVIFELIRKDSIGLFAGQVGGIILHYIGFKYAADGDTLGMLVAVLNSNFWLSIHVTTITFGYGVSLVAGLMGHIYLIRSAFGKVTKGELKTIFNNNYILTLIALFFTLFGTILGGIWADQSWGRFWGWDPKENGALLIVMWHLMLLHLRVSGMVKPLGFAFYSSLVNIIVVLAWFGVNLLSVGLHSYGFTDNVATNLYVFILFEIVFCSILYFIARKNKVVKI